jgi:hypothetical protein
LDRIVLISLLTMIIHTAETLSYSVRMAGIRTGKLALAISLTGLIVLISRTSNVAQGSMTGKIIDYAKNHVNFNIESQFRIIIGAATIGTFLAILLFPTFVGFATRMISHLEAAGSFPRMIKKSLNFTTLKHMLVYIRLPKWAMFKRFAGTAVPKRLMVINCVVTAIYTVGVLSALYATCLPGPYSYGASQSSGLINGIATILLTLLIDPQVALLTERVMSNQVRPAVVTHVFGYLMVSRLCGTLLAQVILVPAAHFILAVIPYI